LLNAVGGMADFVAVDTDDYVERAVRLANDPARLATTRMGLRSKMAASDLCDGRTFMRGVEDGVLEDVAAMVPERG
jgi:predicted O-linked N-acetylglucosamine transferase (SPINDLY family)